MTEAEWRGADNPDVMLSFLHRQAHSWKRRLLGWLRGSDVRMRNRKPRLFACACCRRIEVLLVEERLRSAVITAERHADGMAGEEELSGARARAAESPWGSAAQAATRAAWDDAWIAARVAAQAAVDAVAWTAPEASYRAVADAERRAQSALVRDLFGNPFRRVSYDVRWSLANNGAALQVARSVYEERAFERLPQLADVLEQNGCTSREVLEHLRASDEHARGCWALDLVLGKG